MKPLNYKSEIEEVLKKYNVHITYEDLNKIYLDSSRYYHSTYHINHLLYLIFKNYEYKNIIEKEKDILLLAALFHDIVYIPGRKDNEAKSSERFYYLYHGDISVFLCCKSDYFRYSKINGY
jgi:predicted metal-dependent HD superfamily phosphohydrolase